ncbi:MAG TPA: FHA domain-containing protein, partial [Thermoanaerobaculia bacterium]|nr:FHA domain-containing protein [Thermoanaerobaculia bacterium]
SGSCCIFLVMGTDIRQDGAAAVAFQLGEFTFDPASKLLLHKGEERHLSPKAQQLLYLLLQARPRALSREELYDELWPATYVCETNLAGLVNELRNALGDKGRDGQFIRTVHGYGYAFCGKATSMATRAELAAMLYCEERLHALYEGENSVGRALDGRVVLTGGSVSRHHARIILTGDEVWLEDLKSKNGTYVDGERITRARITPNSELLFGAVGASLILRKRSSTLSLHLEEPPSRKRARS